MQALLDRIAAPTALDSAQISQIIDDCDSITPAEVTIVFDSLLTLQALRSKYNKHGEADASDDAKRKELKINEYLLVCCCCCVRVIGVVSNSTYIGFNCCYLISVRYKLQIIIRLALRSQSHIDPLPSEVITVVVSLLQDISFLTDPAHNGIAVFLEQVLIEQYLYDNATLLAYH